MLIHECRLILPLNVSSHVTFLLHHFFPKKWAACCTFMLMAFRLRPGPRILSSSSKADTGRQFFFSFYSLFAYPFVNRLAYHLYHIRLAQHIRSVASIFDIRSRVQLKSGFFFISWKHFYHYIEMIHKFFALFLVGVFELVFSLSFLKWREMDPNLKPQTLVESFDHANPQFYPGVYVALRALLGRSCVTVHRELSVVTSAVRRDWKLLCEAAWRETIDWAVLQFCTFTSARALIDIDGFLQSLPVRRVHLSTIACYLLNGVTIAPFFP